MGHNVEFRTFCYKHSVLSVLDGHYVGISEHRLLWPVLRINFFRLGRQLCRHMTDEEKLAACRVKRKEIEEYAWPLAQKAAAEQWRRVLAASK